MAPTSSKTPSLPPPSTPTRKSSPELGSPSKLIQYNKSTGRPIRKSAGMVKKVAGYVDSSLLEEEEEGFQPLTSDESEEEMEITRVAKTKQHKRKRSPSPPSPHLGPIIYNQDLEDLTDDDMSGAFHHNTPKKPPVTLQFNVPLGFHGPLFVKLDSALLKGNEEGKRHEMQNPQKKKARTVEPSFDPPAVTVRPKGFTDLPPELRNNIYRYAFVRPKTQQLKIPQRQDSLGLSLSSQFLRTCKLVHDEGCSLLYGENTFHFDRHNDTRAPFWDPVTREIGYQDFLHFLKMIGPENIQYLRHIHIEFDDALPKHTPDLNIETRRYIVDEYLLNCLRILRDAKLKKICMYFFGRRQLFKSDIKFLGYLEQIKADEVEKLTGSWPHSMKISHFVWNDLKAQMTRKKKLYEKK